MVGDGGGRHVGEMSRFAHVHVFDTLADREPGHAVAQLNSGWFLRAPDARVPVRTVGVTKAPVRTMGGMTLLPDATLVEVTAENTAVLLLSGGDTWFDEVHAPVIERARALLSAGVLVAGICGATMRLARDGLLDQRPHTSDNLDALKATCPAYRGEAFFQQAPAVTDGPLITASGLAPLDFAYHILERLEVMSPAALQSWFDLYRTRKPEHYFALMKAIPHPTCPPRRQFEKPRRCPPCDSKDGLTAPPMNGDSVLRAVSAIVSRENPTPPISSLSVSGSAALK